MGQEEGWRCPAWRMSPRHRHRSSLLRFATTEEEPTCERERTPNHNQPRPTPFQSSKSPLCQAAFFCASALSAMGPWPKPQSRKVPVSVECGRNSNEDSGHPVSFDDLQYFRTGSKMALGLLLTPMKSLVPRTGTQCKHFLSRFSALLCAGYKGTQIERPSTLQHWTGG